MANHEREYQQAQRRGRVQKAAHPRAERVYFDPRRERLVIEFSRGEFSIVPNAIQGLAKATAAELKHVQISPSGLGVYFRDLDVDVYVPALLEGVFGTRQWMASQLGSVGGKATSLSKQRAARANGKLGGRPKKYAAG
jgi:hypothetical protein